MSYHNGCDTQGPFLWSKMIQIQPVMERSGQKGWLLSSHSVILKKESRPKFTAARIVSKPRTEGRNDKAKIIIIVKMKNKEMTKHKN